MFLYMAILMAAVVVIAVFKTLSAKCLRYSNILITKLVTYRVQRLVMWVSGIIFFNTILRFLLESYLELCLTSLVNIYQVRQK